MNFEAKVFYSKNFSLELIMDGFDGSVLLIKEIGLLDLMANVFNGEWFSSF